MAETELSDIYDPVAILLSSIDGEAENLSEPMRKHNIKFDQLSDLVEEDLLLLGLKNANTAKEILRKVSQLPNQTRVYSSVMQQHEPPEYAINVRDSIVCQMRAIERMATLLALKIKLAPMQNVLLDNTVYTSQVSLTVCDKIVQQLDELSRNLTDPSVRLGNLTPGKSTVLLLSFGLSAFSVLAAAVWLAKR